jgi:hypothetical protein
MATMSTRDIDWSVVRLSGGFTSARRTLPAHHGSLRPSDWKLEEAEEGPLSERGEDLVRDLAAYEAQSAPPIVESLMPMSMESEANAISDALPPQPVPSARRRPSRGANAFWTGSAAVMSVVALGLVVKLGFDSVHHARTPRPTTEVLASVAGSNESVSFASQPVMTLDTVYVSATDSAEEQAANEKVTPAPAPRTAARTEIPAVAPPRAAIPPQGGSAALMAAMRAPVEISRSATAVAISAAGRRAAGCTTPGTARASMPVSVTYAPSGRVTAARVDGGPFVGTSAGSCIARTLRTATIAPFDGPPVTVHGSVRVP